MRRKTALLTLQKITEQLPLVYLIRAVEVPLLIQRIGTCYGNH